MFGCALPASLWIVECHPSACGGHQGRTCSTCGLGSSLLSSCPGSSCYSKNWCLLWNAGASPFNPLQVTLTNVGGTMPKKKTHLDEMGHVHFLLDEMGLDKMGWHRLHVATPFGYKNVLRVYLPLSSSPGTTISYFCHDASAKRGGGDVIMTLIFLEVPP